MRMNWQSRSREAITRSEEGPSPELSRDFARKERASIDRDCPSGRASGETMRELEISGASLSGSCLQLGERISHVVRQWPLRARKLSHARRATPPRTDDGSDRRAESAETNSLPAGSARSAAT